jgi:hypothetical protein
MNPTKHQGDSIEPLIEVGRRRVAEAKEHGEWSGSVDDREEVLAGRGDAVTVSGSPMKLADHDDEEDPAFVPSAEPADPPIIDMIAERHRLAKPKELGLNVHDNSRPNTSIALLRRTVNVASAHRRTAAPATR